MEVEEQRVSLPLSVTEWIEKAQQFKAERQCPQPSNPNGAHDQFILAANVQSLRKMAKLIPMKILRPA